MLNTGGTLYNGKIIPNISYTPFGWGVLQVDIGYREHWLPLAQEAALILSTHLI
jgi:hypothetical protein